MKYKFGCLPDPRDLRDIPMSMVLPAIPLPGSVDHTQKMSPVRDQGDEGTCVAFASVVGVKEYQDSLEYHKSIGLSPRFTYNLCKKYDGAPSEEGTYPRVAMKVLQKYGTCEEIFWPYQAHQKDRPAKNAGLNAKKYRIRAYARLKGVSEMKRSLLINGPFLAGVEVYKTWFSKKVERTGMIPMPKPKSAGLGGHAICVVGYNDAKGVFKFKNSWSARWADRGYGYLPYAYLEKYSPDVWSATDLIENPAALVKVIERVISRFA